jgi:hypothetical protein
MNKLIKDNKVAVLVSHGFGAGWSTWNSEEANNMVFDADIAQMLIDEKPLKDIQALAETKYPNACVLGINDGLEIEWLDIGERFEITEYDGSESLELLKNKNFYQA